MSWDSVWGQNAPVRQLRALIEADRLPPACLLVGPVGVGRRTLAAALTSALLCTEQAADPCGACRSCRLVAANNHPDRIELERTKEHIGVDEMREFCSQITLAPAMGNRRVGILPDADRLTDAAANCFLKTLEEPPPGVLLLLRSESTDRLLRTIVSRCQIVRLGPLPPETLVQALQAAGTASPEEAALLADVAEGSLGRALQLRAGATGENWQWISTALPHLRPGNALAFSEDFLARAAGPDHPLRSGATHLLDLAALHLRRELRHAQPPAREGLRKLEAIWTAGEELRRNVTTEIVIRALALALAGA